MFYKLTIFIYFIIILFNFNIAYSKPYIPGSGTEVLILLDPVSQRSQFEDLKVTLYKNKNMPNNLIKILQETIELGKSISDPRYIGFVSSYVDTYLKEKPNNYDFMVLKARILQHDHKFNEALNILNTVIVNAPTITNARLLRASVLQVQAKYQLARQDCYSLLGKASHLVTISCIAQIDGITKNTKRNYTTLKRLIENNNNDSISELSWSYDILAQLALQLNESKPAEQHYQQGLKISPDNIPLLNSYSDLLLSKHEYHKVLNLLKSRHMDFTVLLRLAIAEKHSSTNTQYQNQFLSRLQKMQSITDLTHQREIAAYYLLVKKDANKALHHAIQNWNVQKELYDAQLLLKCALISKDLISAEPVINWYFDNSISDARINSLINKITPENNNVVNL